MAFSTSNVQVAQVANGVKFYVGDWSGVAGDAPGSITVGGGRIYSTDFRDEDATGPQENPWVSVSASAGVMTLSVYNHSTVTNGRFCIVYS